MVFNNRDQVMNTDTISQSNETTHSTIWQNILKYKIKIYFAWLNRAIAKVLSNESDLLTFLKEGRMRDFKSN